MKTLFALMMTAAVVAVLPLTPVEAKTKIVTYADEPGMDVPAAGPGEAVIVFIRASNLGGIVAATVYERAEDGNATFITAVYPDTYMVHKVTPGKHIFAVVSEAADFIEVDAAAGKIYPIVVRPRVGAWKARFSLASGSPGTEFWDRVKGWLDDSSRVTPNEAAPIWFDQNRSSVMAKLEKYWPKWTEKPDKPIVKSEDGVTGF
jgi:hypothetical protein